MKFISAKCPSCHGDLQVPDDRDFVICMYCGTTVKIREAIRVMLDSNIPNLNNLGIEALKAGNYQEAYDYFSKVLESDTKNSEAWYNKALACGNLSSFSNNRDSEMNSYFEKAIKCNTEEKIPEFKNKIAEELHNFNLKFFDKIKEHMNENITNENVYKNYIENCKQIIRSLEIALNYNPNQINSLRFLLNIGNDNMKVIQYSVLDKTQARTFYQNKKHSPNLEYKTYLQNKQKEWQEKLILIDPSYKDQIERNKAIREKEIQGRKTQTRWFWIIFLTTISFLIIMGFLITYMKN